MNEPIRNPFCKCAICREKREEAEEVRLAQQEKSPRAIAQDETSFLGAEL